MDIKWNRNGNWLLTASRDHLLKLFDIRNTKEEVQTFRGHKKEASTIAWHPVHEGLFASGGSDGAIMFWNVGAEKEVGVIEQAHDSIVWALDWHPIGHILCSGSNDHTCKFWTRNRPGDSMRDKYNLNTAPQGNEEEASVAGSANASLNNSMADNLDSATTFIPGMAPEDRVESGPASSYGNYDDSSNSYSSNIPGLDQEESSNDRKKVPYAKPIPRSFQASWAGVGGPPEGPNYERMPPPNNYQQPQQQQQQYQGSVWSDHSISLQELQRNATAVVAFGNVYPVLQGSNLYMSILSGERAVKDVLRSEFFNT